jgi:hypothetical protein
MKEMERECGRKEKRRQGTKDFKERKEGARKKNHSPLNVNGTHNIALMMEAVSTYETSVNIYQITRRNIPEGSYSSP